jgi:psiF repeat
MKQLTILLGLAIAVFGAQAQTPAPEKATTPQQQKMKTCNADAKGKSGDERKAFMKDCLSAKPGAAAGAANGTPQQEKMKACNAGAKGKSGDERKAFMKECLSAKS